MIQIQLTKKDNHYKKLKVSGHSITEKNFLKSEKIEEKIGDNVLCAAVSVLTQSLYIFCKKKELIFTEKMSDGFLEFDLNKSVMESNSAFEMVEMGLLNLRDQYPKEIEIAYLKA